MGTKISLLQSTYIIDGVTQELTPAAILDAVSELAPAAEDAIAARIVDESLEPEVSPAEWDAEEIDVYLNAVLEKLGGEREVPLIFADSYTRFRIATALLDCLWRMGSFRIGDVSLDAAWHWNTEELGASSAFYSSIQAAGEFLDSLGVSLRSYEASAGYPYCSLAFAPGLRGGTDEESLIERPYTTASPKLGAASLPSSLVPDESSWIVYIPFDSSAYRMGGSLFAQAMKFARPVAPLVDDADYFQDCFEVVRELVEDGIIISASTVGDGGLLTALKGMTTERTGAEIDLSDLKKATSEDDNVRLLFAEVPGALIQVRDADFDYIDAELLLQDVAFYPLGHPVAGGNIRVKSSAKTGIQNILDALARRQGGEGED